MTSPLPLNAEIESWARDLGFSGVGVSGCELPGGEARLAKWLANGFHGEMDYMAKHGLKRSRPSLLVPGTLSVISARMDYFVAVRSAGPGQAAVSRYALGRDYHKLLKKRLELLASRIRERVGEFGYRVFVDSAPVLEVELASQAGIGWRGKNSLLLSRAGSWFFLGEIYTDLPLAPSRPQSGHCGSCQKCIDACPTGAIVEAGVVDARRCISYLTIEKKGEIPIEFRKSIGNRIYGCDDCQSCCPWNRFAKVSDEPDFSVRNHLDAADLVELFAWSEEQFRSRMAGSAILRIGHVRWLRNIAVALGNAPKSARVTAALAARLDHPEQLVREHVEWARSQHSA